MTEKPQTHLHGTVDKIIKPLVPDEAEKAQISVEQADPLYKEIRIENTLTDAEGNSVHLKPGAHVDVVVQADPEDTTIKKEKP